VRSNTVMSPQRVGVEWAFGKISQITAFVDQYRVHSVQVGAVAKVYVLAAILANIHTCLYYGLAASYWQISPPTIGSYCNKPEYDRVYLE
jgi:hypothetical protein